MDERLRSEIWIKAHLRRCFAEGIPATVVHKGEINTGTLMLKLHRYGEGCRVLSQVRDWDGAMAWLPAFKGATVPESEADDYIQRAIQRDPDLWVVEIDHPEGWHPFEGKEL